MRDFTRGGERFEIVCIRCLEAGTYPFDEQAFNADRKGICPKCAAAQDAGIINQPVQRAFDLDPPPARALGGGRLAEVPRLQERFEAFHLANPLVYRALVRFAGQAIDAGHDRLSIWLLANRLRWEAIVSTTGDDYRINNNFLALYARLAMAKEPRLDGFFETRKLKDSEAA